MVKFIFDVIRCIFVKRTHTTMCIIQKSISIQLLAARMRIAWFSGVTFMTRRASNEKISEEEPTSGNISIFPALGHSCCRSTVLVILTNGAEQCYYWNIMREPYCVCSIKSSDAFTSNFFITVLDKREKRQRTFELIPLG